MAQMQDDKSAAAVDGGKDSKQTVGGAPTDDSATFSRDEFAKNQEDQGLVSFRVVCTDLLC